MYQIANIYLLLFAGSIWDSLSEAIENPKAIVSLISAALPKVSIFFINYIITIWLSGVPYKMIRRFCAVQYLYYRSCTSDQTLTRRMLKNPAGPFGETRVGYGTELSDVLYVLCVVMLYWVIAPIVLLLAAGLFWSWYFAWKYQYVFVITRTFESGGQFWYRLYRYSMLGLMAGTIVFMAFMGIKEGVSQGPLLVPLPIIIYMSWRYTERRFKDQSKNLAFASAVKQERSASGSDLSSLAHSPSEDRTGGGAFAGFTSAFPPTPTPRNETIIDTHSEPESSHLPGARHGFGPGHHHQQVHFGQSQASSHGQHGHGHGAAVVSNFRENFMKQPNLLCPAKVYPYPYRLYDFPLLDKYGSLNEIYLDDIPEGVDPATLFPANAIPTYSHTGVSVSTHGTADEESGAGTSRAGTAHLYTPLNLAGMDGKENDLEEESDSLL